MSYEKAVEAAEFIKSKYAGDAETAIVLGSGLARLRTSCENAVRDSVLRDPGFCRSTVEGHAGQLVLGEIDGIPVVGAAGPVPLSTKATKWSR